MTGATPTLLGYPATRWPTLQRMRRTLTLLVAATAFLAACSDDSSNTQSLVDNSAVITTAAPTSEVPTTAATTTAPPDTTTAPTPKADPSRPYDVFVPTTYDATTPMPLLLLLHGYSASGDIQEAYFQMQALAEARGFLYVHPDGTVNPIGEQFWNATPACCGFNSKVDDSQYLLDIITDVSNTYSVDPKRIYVMGHSNGGFMSYRMACDHADVIAAVASLAGATFDDTAACTPAEPVSVLQVHGTADATISYTGGEILGNAYPGAIDTAAKWAGYNGCTGGLGEADPTPADFDQSVPGAETTEQFHEGCPTGVAVGVWTIDGGSHIPPINTAAAPYPLTSAIVDFLLAHPKP